MARIESPKAYVGQDLSEIFFRPMLTGPDANKLGIQIMYNMPVPTTVHMWRRSGDILQKYTTGGWNGANSKTERFSKKISLSRVKAEMGYGADEYYNLVYGLLANTPEALQGDLSGTELEKAETELFRQSVAESLRATMWVGYTGHDDPYHTFDGFLVRLFADSTTGSTDPDTKPSYYASKPLADLTPDTVVDYLKMQFDNAEPELRDLKSEGQLAYFVTSAVYNAYEEYVDSSDNESAWLARQNGRTGLFYRGIPLVDVQIDAYMNACTWLPKAFSLLTDRRNLVLAVNTADFPGTEVKMWYNPDAMENRQRAVFMAGADYLMPELISCIKFE